MPPYTFILIRQIPTTIDMSIGEPLRITNLPNKELKESKDNKRA